MPSATNPDRATQLKFRVKASFGGEAPLSTLWENTRLALFQQATLSN